ncbi:MAG: hypothetical protein CMO80_16630 [Verrucomicrobiales bacterium]|nr:hypothetical protein [Verrucomicrobiales bacterium]
MSIAFVGLMFWGRWGVVLLSCYFAVFHFHSDMFASGPDGLKFARSVATAAVLYLVARWVQLRYLCGGNRNRWLVVAVVVLVFASFLMSRDRVIHSRRSFRGRG